MFSVEAPKDASFQMTVKTASLTPTDEVNARDRPEIESRMHQEVLESAAYPEARYQAAAASVARIADNWYRIQFNGSLSLHGITQPHVVDAQVMLMEDSTRLSGEFKLSLSAYRMKRVSALAGAITLKDELKLTFDLIAVKTAG